MTLKPRGVPCGVFTCSLVSNWHQILISLKILGVRLTNC